MSSTSEYSCFLQDACTVNKGKNSEKELDFFVRGDNSGAREEVEVGSSVRRMEL
jgi:hypothetical protein